MDKKKIQLLIADLSSRLPYGVKGLHRGQIHSLFTIDCREITNACIQVDDYDAWFSIDTFKPYLRPLESMSEEEREEFRMLGGVTSYSPQHNRWAIIAFSPEAYDWLNKKMFDFRGLLPTGLALEAKEGLYKTE